MNCAECGSVCALTCAEGAVLYCSEDCHTNARVGGGLSGNTNFKARLTAFALSLAELRDAKAAMLAPGPLTSKKEDVKKIKAMYVRMGNAYENARAKGDDIASMMNSVRLPGKLRRTKGGGDGVTAALDGHFLDHWAHSMTEQQPITADFLNALADGIAPFFDNDSRVHNAIQTISRALQVYVSSSSTSPATIAANRSKLTKEAQSQGQALDEIYADMIKKLKSTK